MEVCLVRRSVPFHPWPGVAPVPVGGQVESAPDLNQVFHEEGRPCPSRGEDDDDDDDDDDDYDDNDVTVTGDVDWL